MVLELGPDMPIQSSSLYPVFYDQNGNRCKLELLENSEAGKIYYFLLSSGHWTFFDVASEDVSYRIDVAIEAKVQIYWHRNAAEGRRSVYMDLGKKSMVQCDIMDASSLSEDIWRIHAQSESHCTVNHALYTASSRQHRVEIIPETLSVCHHRQVLYLTENATVNHQLHSGMHEPSASVHHHVHGVACQKARGNIESFLHMYPLSSGASSYQFIKVFITDDAAWKMQPDLIIDHDDVSAQHGACHGVIEAEWVLYAAARGIDAEAFRSMYLKNFLLSVLQQPSTKLLEWVESQHREKYV